MKVKEGNLVDKGLKFLDEYVKTWQELSKKVDRNPLKYFIPISCIQAKNTDKVIEAIFEFLPAGEPFYSSDTKTDFPQQMFIEEIIREKEWLQDQVDIKEYIDPTLSVEEIIKEAKEQNALVIAAHPDNAGHPGPPYSLNRRKSRPAGIFYPAHHRRQIHLRCLFCWYRESY